MYKTLGRMVGIVSMIMIILHSDKAIDIVTNFFIGGIIPFTNIAIDTPETLLLILLLLILIRQAFDDLKQSMLKRSAILYTASKSHMPQKSAATQNTQVQNIDAIRLTDTDELTLANN